MSMETTRDFNAKGVKSLHIVYSTDNRVGGALHAALGVAQFLTRAGHRADIAATALPTDETEYLAKIYPELKVFTFPRSFPARYANSNAFAAWFREYHSEYDVVEIHSLFTCIAWRAVWICTELGKPYVVRPHGSLDPFDLQKHALLKRMVGPIVVRPLLARSRGAMLTTSLEADRMEAYGAKVRRMVHALPVVLGERSASGDSFRQRHRIPDDARLVLFMSRIDYKKGLEFLIPAIGELQQEFPNLWLVLAGSGENSFTIGIERLVLRCGLGAKTRWVGFISGQEKTDALAAADVFALPSLNENFGIVLIEAMNAGVPLLISDEVYIHREVSDAGAGVVCQPTMASVKSSLRSLLAGEVDLSVMGEQGRRLVQERYLPDQATKSLIATYRSILEGRESSTAYQP
jgi:glycosyltransferase involved in cell wall biosynthesis